MGTSRTILTEYVKDGKDNPLYGGDFSVIASRLPGYGGFGTDKITARIVNNHFLIVNSPQVQQSDVRLEEILGIVDIDKPQEAEDRMYEEAKTIAEERAKLDRNIVIDLTSKAKAIPEEAQYYVGCFPNYWALKKKLALNQQ